MKLQCLRRKCSLSRSFMVQRSCPKAVTFPASGFNRPDKIAKRVVFPLPEGPIISATSPCLISMETSFTAVVRISPSPNDLKSPLPVIEVTETPERILIFDFKFGDVDIPKNLC